MNGFTSLRKIKSKITFCVRSSLFSCGLDQFDISSASQKRVKKGNKSHVIVRIVWIRKDMLFCCARAFFFCCPDPRN